MSAAGDVAALRRLGAFEHVLDVGGNVGEWAELARGLWPAASLTSFEPIPALADLNRDRARGRWVVEPVALSDSSGEGELLVCLNQHSASTMEEPGPLRRQAWGIADQFKPIRIQTRLLDEYLPAPGPGRLLVKVDVEGHEGPVLAGGPRLLERADAVIVECQQSPDGFDGAWTPAELDVLLRDRGLYFAGVVGALLTPAGEVAQFDGLWLGY